MIGPLGQKVLISGNFFVFLALSFIDDSGGLECRLARRPCNDL